jgi:hypothetical protein
MKADSAHAPRVPPFTMDPHSAKAALQQALARSQIQGSLWIRPVHATKVRAHRAHTNPARTASHALRVQLGASALNRAQSPSIPASRVRQERGRLLAITRAPTAWLAGSNPPRRLACLWVPANSVVLARTPRMMAQPPASCAMRANTRRTLIRQSVCCAMRAHATATLGASSPPIAWSAMPGNTRMMTGKLDARRAQRGHTKTARVLNCATTALPAISTHILAAMIWNIASSAPLAPTTLPTQQVYALRALKVQPTPIMVLNTPANACIAQRVSLPILRA